MNCITPCQLGSSLSSIEHQLKPSFSLSVASSTDTFWGKVRKLGIHTSIMELDSALWQTLPREVWCGKLQICSKESPTHTCIFLDLLKLSLPSSKFPKEHSITAQSEGEHEYQWPSRNSVGADHEPHSPDFNSHVPSLLSPPEVWGLWWIPTFLFCDLHSSTTPMSGIGSQCVGWEDSGLEGGETLAAPTTRFWAFFYNIVLKPSVRF